LFLVSLYTPWMLIKKYDPESDALVKSWFLNPFNSKRLLDISNQNYAAILNTLTALEPRESSPIPTLKLRVKNNALEELNHGIIKYHFGWLKRKPRVKGFFETKNGSFSPVTLNLRGTYADHHQVWKPSLRIKFNKNKLESGFRNHILIAPRDGIGFENWFSNYLGGKWNILTNQEHFVRLFINDKYFGVYNRTMRLEESLLIDSNLLPGPFLRLERYAKQYFLPNFSLYWNTPEAWEIVGASKEYGLSVIDRAIKIMLPIGEQLKQIWEKNSPQSLNQIKKINEIFDAKEFAKYLAILSFAGENHIDSQHNNALFLDPGSGKLIPILQDVTGYYFKPKKGQRSIIKLNPAYMYYWHLNPKNFSLFIDRLYELLQTFGSFTRSEETIRNQWAKIRKDIFADTHFSIGSNGRVLTSLKKSDLFVERFIQAIYDRNQWMIKQLNQDKLSLIKIDENNFEIYIEGLAGATIQKKDGTSFNLNNRTGTVQSWDLIPSVNRQTSNKIRKKLKLPESYIFYNLPGNPQDYIFTHRLNRQILKYSSTPQNISTLKAFAGPHPFDFEQPNTTPVTIGPGIVTFNQTKEYEKGQPVTILAGTEIRLAPRASLIFQGPLKIVGLKNAPVKIRPLESDNPFGVVALFGHKTRGSRISYLDIKGGSTALRYNLNFTGMLSIHDCPDIEIIHSRFGQNFIGDDGVHIVRSSIKIKHSTFETSHLDALDLDKVDGEISNSKFINSGNDGLDISMGHMKVTDSLFSGCADKCISAGEGTNTTIKNSKFMECTTGVAVKDRSNVKISGSYFSRCHVSLHSFRKKWRWENGGNVEVSNTQFLESFEADIKGDKHSKIVFPKGLPENIKIEGKIAIKTSSFLQSKNHKSSS
jgi:hypothetical protein